MNQWSREKNTGFPNDLIAETLKVGEKFPFTEWW